MKAYWIEPQEGRLNIALRTVPTPTPADQQVVVHMRAAGLNRGEFLPGHKTGSAKPIGNEVAGEIVEVGPGISQYKVGDRVMARARGAFADYVLVDVHEIFPMPPTLSWEEAASIPLVFTVAYDMLVAEGHAQPGEWLLVTGVSSGVGVASLQLGKALGMKVIGTSRSAEKLDRLKPHGLDAGLLTQAGHDLVAETLQATDQHGADLVVNTVGGSVFPACLHALAYEGRLATVGYVDGVLKSEIDIRTLHEKRLKLFGVSNRYRTTKTRVPLLQGFARDVVPLFASGRIRPLVDRVYPFDQLETARARMEDNLQVGKIVLTAAA